MSTAYILVANASQATIYASEKAKLFNGAAELDLVADTSHPDSRERNHDLVTDKSGRHESLRSGHGTFVEPTDPHQREAEKFARKLVDDLEKAYLKNKFQELIVAAPPKFHGALNKYLEQRLRDIVSVDIKKDYTKFSAKELLAHLGSYI